MRKIQAILTVPGILRGLTPLVWGLLAASTAGFLLGLVILFTPLWYTGRYTAGWLVVISPLAAVISIVILVRKEDM